MAYGRLTPLKDGEFLISQLVVDPEYQHHGDGSKLLADIMITGVNRGAIQFGLSARTTATELYKDFGLSIAGSVWKFPRAGVSHVKMVNLAKRDLSQFESTST